MPKKKTISILFLFCVILSIFCGVLYEKNNTLQDHCNSLQTYSNQMQWIVSELSNGNLDKPYGRLYKYKRLSPKFKKKEDFYE